MLSRPRKYLIDLSKIMAECFLVYVKLIILVSIGAPGKSCVHTRPGLKDNDIEQYFLQRYSK